MQPRICKWLGAGMLGLAMACTPAFAQLGSRTTASSARNSFGGAATQGFGAGATSGVSQASQSVGTILNPSDFGGSGQGSLLRSAIESQTMVGISNQAMGGQFGAMGMGMGMGRGQMGMMGNQLGMTGNQQNQQRRGANLRIPMRIGFEARPTVALERATRFESRIPNFPGLEKVRGVAVKLDGRTAILQGTVGTDRERDLLARLAMLEPGISAVENELAVAPPGPLAPLPVLESP